MGERVRRRRRELGLRQADLAERLGLDDSTVRAIESGRRGVSLDTLVALANALDVPAGWLVEQDVLAQGLDEEAARVVRTLAPDWQRVALNILREIQSRVGSPK